MRRIIPISLSLCFITVAAQAQNWPGFRGPNASGVAEGHKTPVSWDATKSTNVLWKVAIPGLAHSCPIVWGDRVYVTSAVSSDPNPYFRHGNYGDVDTANDLIKHQWKVYALDKRTGKIVWEKTAHEGVPKTKRHIKSTHANSTPATDGKHIVAFFGSEGLYCYDTGREARLEAGPRGARFGLVLRPGLSMGDGELAHHLQEPRHNPVRRAEELFYRRFRHQDGQAGVAHRRAKRYRRGGRLRFTKARRARRL